MDKTLPLSLEREGLAEQVARQIQELILSRALEPGDRLPAEYELAAQLQVSRGVVREAVRILRVRGLVETRRGSGSYVRQPSPQTLAASMRLLLRSRWGLETFRDLFEMRNLLEVTAARLAAERAQEEDVRRLRASIRGMEAHLDDVGFAEFDVAFHQALAEAAHNMFFRTFLSAIRDALAAQTYFPDEHETSRRAARLRALEIHSRIVECIAARDAKGAQKAMRTLLEEAERRVQALRQRATMLQEGRES